MAVREGTFYAPWPNIDGKPLQLQWGEIRSNQAELKAIVRNSQQELETGVDELNALRAYLGQAFGDLDFRNKYRLMYDQVTKEFCLQKNDGTVDTPIWTDVWCVRYSDGQFQVVSQGGIQSSAGFYGPGLTKLGLVADSVDLGTPTTELLSFENTEKIFFDTASGLKLRQIDCGTHKGSPEVTFTAPFGRAQTFNASGQEWVINHGFNTAPQMVQVMDSDDRVIIPDTVDVSDPNTAYFYFHATVVGSVIIATGGTGAAELRPRDPFYLVVRTDDKPSAGNTLDPNAELIFDSNFFYVNADERVSDCRDNPRAFVSLQRELFYIDDLKDVTSKFPITTGHVLTWQESESAYVPQEAQGGALYLNDLKDVAAPSPTGGDMISYNQSTGSWETVAAIRSGSLHTQVTPATEWIVSHAQNSEVVIAQVYDTSDRQIFPDVQDVSNPDIAYFYFTEAVAGKVFVIPTGPASIAGDHSDLAGLGADDHEQYLLVDGSRAMSGGLEGIVGSASIPSFAFTGALTSGFFRKTTDGDLGLSTQGIERMSVGRDGIHVEDKVRAEAFYVKTGGQLNEQGLLAPNDNAVAKFNAPEISFTGAPDVGFTLESANQIAFVTAGVPRFRARSNGIAMNSVLLISGGSVAVPGLAFSSILAQNTGIFRVNTNEIGFTHKGTQKVRIGDAGIHAVGFYVEPDTLGVSADLNQGVITFQIETLAQKNYFIDGCAPFTYIIDKVVLRSESGFGNASFYINPDTGTGAGRYGSPIAGLTDFYIGPIKRVFTPDTPVVVTEGDEWFMGVADVPTASDVAGTVTLRRAG